MQGKMAHSYDQWTSRLLMLMQPGKPITLDLHSLSPFHTKQKEENCI